MSKKGLLKVTRVSVLNAKGPPVPIPNTEVKLFSAEDTWLETARENRSKPTQYRKTKASPMFSCLIYEWKYNFHSASNPP